MSAATNSTGAAEVVEADLLGEEEEAAAERVAVIPAILAIPVVRAKVATRGPKLNLKTRDFKLSAHKRRFALSLTNFFWH